MKSKSSRINLLVLIINLFFLFNTTFAYGSSTTQEYVVDIPELNKITLHSGKTIELYGTSLRPYEQYANNLRKKSINEENVTTLNELFNDKIHKSFFSIATEYHNGYDLINNIINNKEIKIELVKDNKYIVIYGDLNLNLFLVQKGYVDITNLLVGSRIDTELIIAKDDARSIKRGIWSHDTQLEVGGNSQIKPILLPIRWFFLIIYISFLVVLFFRSWNSLFECIYFYLATILSLGLFLVDKWFNAFSLEVLIPLLVIICIMIILIVFKHKHFWHNFISLIFLALFIIITFAISYYNISNNQPHNSIRTFMLSQNNTMSSNIVRSSPTDNYLIVPDDYYETNERLKVKTYSLSLLDSFYFSCITYFTGAYGEIVPRGYLRFIVVSEMLVSFTINTFIITILISRCKAEDVVPDKLIYKIDSIMSNFKRTNVKDSFISLSLLCLFLILLFIRTIRYPLKSLNNTKK